MSPRHTSGAGRETQAVFARIPVAEADKLDRAAFELGARKQDLIRALVARYLDPDTPEGQSALARLSPGGDRRRVVVETDEGGLAVGRHSFRPVEGTEVLTVEQAAELLQVDVETILALAGEGDLPGRRVGDDWRFSREAILRWLAGSEDETG